MPENNNSGADINVTIDSLNDKSESITDSLEDIEEELDIKDDEMKISDDLRLAFLKIKSLSRSNNNQILQNKYSQILEQYNSFGERTFSGIPEYLDSTKELLNDLGLLQTSQGEKLADTSIDGGLFEAGTALIDGVTKAGETIYEEIKGYFEMVGMAGELPSILEKIWDSLSMETFSDIYDALVDMGGDIIRDFNLILNNSTPIGKAVELSNFIPAIGIPLLFETVGPGKFFKILKLDKLIPLKVIGAMEGTIEKGKGFTSDIVRDNFSISNNISRKDSALKLLKDKYGDEFKGLSEKQLDGIIETHEIGQDVFEKYLKENGLNVVSELSDIQIREIFNSKEGRIVLRKKMKKMSEIGLKGDDASDLIRSGITGGVSEDFSMLLNQDFTPSSYGTIKSRDSDKGNIAELFGDSIDNTQILINRADEIKIASRVIKDSISELSEGLNEIGEKIKNLGMILSPQKVLTLSKELNQEYGVILSKYKELGGLNDELKSIGNQVEKFDTISNTNDIVDRLIKRIDFDKGGFDITKNNYIRMNNQLQIKLDKFRNDVKKNKIELDIITEPTTLLESLLKT